MLVLSLWCWVCLLEESHALHFVMLIIFLNVMFSNIFWRHVYLLMHFVMIHMFIKYSLQNVDIIQEFQWHVYLFV